MANTKITSNVLNSISERIKTEGFSDNSKALLVFNGSNIDLDKKLRYLQDIRGKGIDFSLGFSFMAENLVDTQKIINTLKPGEIFREEDIYKLEKIAGSHSMIIGPNITINTLSKVALGMIDSFISSVIWTFLYQGKRVYLDFTSVRNYLGNSSKSKEITDITERNIQTLLKMGAVEIKDNYMDKIQTLKNNDVTDNKAGSSTKKDLITQKDIENMSAKGLLIFEKGTVITPLAKDKAKELGIQIQIK